MVLEFRHSGAYVLRLLAIDPRIELGIRLDAAVEHRDAQFAIDRTFFRQPAGEGRKARCRARDRAELAQPRHLAGEPQERILDDFAGDIVRHAQRQEAEPHGEEAPGIAIELDAEGVDIGFKAVQDEGVFPHRPCMQHYFEQRLLLVRM